MTTRTGFVALVGPSNSGKSTFLNSVLGKKVSIVSHRPQTTLRTVRGIVTEERGQLIFIDTPGLQKRLQGMGGVLNKLVDDQAKGCDVLVWMFDVSKPNCLPIIRQMVPMIKQWKPNTHSVCILNKVDKVSKPKLLPLMEAIIKLDLFSQTIPISATKRDGLDSVLSVLFEAVPEGGALYPEEQSTDRSEDFLISEIVREKIYRLAWQEIPYSVKIDVERMTGQSKKDIPHLLARVHADSSSRKAILIGKRGEMLKKVGVMARKDIEQMLGRQVCLKIQVDVQKDWRKDKRMVKQYLEIES